MNEVKQIPEAIDLDINLPNRPIIPGDVQKRFPSMSGYQEEDHQAWIQTKKQLENMLWDLLTPMNRHINDTKNFQSGATDDLDDLRERLECLEAVVYYQTFF